MHGTTPSDAIYLDYEISGTSGVLQYTTFITPFKNMEKFE